MKEVDVAIVGSGPAGLSAAISAAADGRKVLVLDSAEKWGGQAGHATRIENIFGYPFGIDGHTLAHRSVEQAKRLGVEFLQARVEGLSPDGLKFRLPGDDFHTPLIAKATVLAMGVNYRRLDPSVVPRELEGKSVFYVEAMQGEKICRLRPCVVVGGANSAGQAAIYLARYAPKVHLVVRGPSLEKGMSAYLYERIRQTPNIEVHLDSTVDHVLDWEGGIHVEISRTVDGQSVGRALQASAMFVMIGAEPNAAWTGLRLDEHGFIDAPDFLGYSKNNHPLQPIGNVLVVGDIRSGSVKLVASAAGEGATVMRHINRIMNS